MDLDAGIADRTDGDGQSNPLQERKIDVDVEPLRLEAGETVGDGSEGLTDRIEMVQPFLETEIGEVLTLISTVRRSGGCQQFDNLIDGLVGAVVGGFELAVWAIFCVGLVVEAAVGEWPA